MGLEWPIPGGMAAAEFMVSPSPWVTSSVATGIVGLAFRDVTLSGSAADITYVARWVKVTNKSAATLSVAFTRRGFNTSNYFDLAQNETFQADLRISQIWLSGSGNNYNVVAGLTGIQNRMVPAVTGSNGFPGVG